LGWEDTFSILLFFIPPAFQTDFSLVPPGEY